MSYRRPVIGGRYRFEYPKEPEFNCTLTVTRVRGGLAFFDDGSHAEVEFLQTLGDLGAPAGPAVALDCGGDEADAFTRVREQVRAVASGGNER